jgi:YD repeat-containing protein
VRLINNLNNSLNKIKFTDSNGVVIRYGYGIKDTTNTFPDNMTNSKNQSVIYFYDLKSGNLLAQRDSNNFVKNYTYDALSIDKSTILPFDTIGLPTQEYEYNFTSTNADKIVIKQREQNNTSNTLDKYKFYDGFGRLIQTKTESINGKQIAVDYYYDFSGKIKAQTNPYFVSASTDYSSPNMTVGKTNYTYDVLDRVIAVINQDGSIKNISYSRWNVSIKDENGNNATYSKDAYGRIVKVIEYNGAEKYVTNYLYDSSNNLLSITDSLNNTFNYTYDSLGRKIKDKDPDKGTWNYTYDNESNLIKQFDARNISTSWIYDSLNRKINETSQGGSVLFFYDIGINGTLSSAKINNTLVNYSYDGRLRKIAEKVNVTSQKSYSTNWTYDSADRVTSQIMPDGRIINYTYDDQGLLSTISEVVSVIYNENNNPNSINYSNGINTSYLYNSSNFRLVQINTQSKQNLNYGYDAVGNVLNIVDNIHSTNYSMTYDPLNRLATTIIGGDYNVVLGFVYDQIGNIRNVTGNYAANYYYQDSRPHATSQVVYY